MAPAVTFAFSRNVPSFSREISRTFSREISRTFAGTGAWHQRRRQHPIPFSLYNRWIFFVIKDEHFFTEPLSTINLTVSSFSHYTSLSAMESTSVNSILDTQQQDIFAQEPEKVNISYILISRNVYHKRKCHLLSSHTLHL